MKAKMHRSATPTLISSISIHLSLSLLFSLKLLYHQMPMGSPTLPAANSSQEPAAGPVHERGLLPAVEDLAGERACRAETEKPCRGDRETV